MTLDMYAPFKARNFVEFVIEPKGEVTSVTWSMEGKQPLIAKLVWIFINCDKMVGGEFEKGLASLKAVAEA